MDSKLVEQQFVEEQLPLEALYHILSLLENKSELLKARLVNKTWYHLIMGSKNITDFLEQEFNNLFKEKISNYPLPLYDKNFSSLVTITKTLTTKTKNPILSRSKIALLNQMHPNNLLHIFKMTCIGMAVAIFDRSSLLTRRGGTIFGPATPRKVVAAALLLWFYVGNLVYLIDGQRGHYVEEMLSIPYKVAIGLYDKHKYSFLIVFTFLYLRNFYVNYLESKEIFEKQVVHELEEIRVTKEIEGRAISNPAEYITMHWRRDKIFGKQVLAIPKEENNEGNFDLHMKKNI